MIELSYKGQNVDYEESITGQIALTYRIADIYTLNQINSSYSKSFDLPSTRANDALFDYSSNPNNESFSTLKEPQDAILKANGLEIMRGKALVKSSRKKTIGTGYEMSLLGDNYEAYAMLQDIQVSGLDFGTFQLSKANVESSWGYTSASGNATFAPIDFGNLNLNSFAITDLVPSFFIKNILTKGFDSAGIAYESNWLDSAFASRLTTPFNGIWILQDASYTTVSGANTFLAISGGITVSAGGAGTKQYIDIAQSTSNINYNPTNAAFLAPDPSETQFTFTFDPTWAATYSTYGAVKMQVGIEVNGVTVEERKIYAVNSTETETVQTGIIPIQAGDIVKPYFITEYDIDVDSISWSSNVSRNIAEGMTVTLANYVPIKKDGLTVFDLLKGLAGIYNLQFLYNSANKTLKFEPYSSFYSGDLDWSSKWNQSQDAELQYLGDQLNREILHKYKEDSTDYWLTRWNDGYEEREPYASYLHELPRNYKKGRNTIENFLFAPTTDYQHSTFGVTIPNIRWNTKDGTQFSGGRSGQIPEIRILYFVGKDTSGTFKMTTGTGNAYTVNSYAYTPRLAFRAQVGETWQSLAMDSFVGGTTGAFATYFEPKYRNIHNGITAYYYLNLTERDIIASPLDKRIWLDGAWWYIQQIIDYNPLANEPTKVELLKVEDISFTVNSTKSKWIDIITGKRFDPVTIKPNNDLPSNIGVDVSTSGIVPRFDDAQGTSAGNGHQLPRKASTWAWGEGALSYSSNQFIFGRYNAVDADAILMVGGGTSVSGRRNAFAIREGDEGYEGKINGYKVMTDQFSYTTSGVQRSNYKTFTGSGTTAGDGTLTVYPTLDNTESGDPIFTQVNYASAFIINSTPPITNYIGITRMNASGVTFESNGAGTQNIIYKIEGY